MPRDPVPLGELARIVGADPPDRSDLEIVDVTHDSRTVGPGTLFVALRGERHDGHRFLDEAVAGGSPAVCVEDPGRIPEGVPALIVDDTRRALAQLADCVFDHPSGRLRLVGVTGTNGKTTVTHMVHAICRAAGVRSAYAGTVGARIVDTTVPMARTTPEASDFQRMLSTMVDAGVRIAAVEVSSHGLALRRVDATDFSVAAFTNLSPDHLDLHGDMESYYLAKRQLFERAATAVVWVGDEWGRRLASETSVPTTTVGFESADVVGVVDRLGFDATTMSVTASDGGAVLRVPLAGRFNAANALVAAAIGRALDLRWDTIAAGVSSVSAVPGRFELVETGRDLTVIVDYAHTPDGIAATIAATRDIVAGTARIVAVVGAGGDRDRSKRPLMGAAVAAADVAVITSDNPRTEDPVAIVDEVAAGVPADAFVVVEVDRRMAIRQAIRLARPGDVVLLLGKGHETGQEVGDTVIPFDDRIVVREEAGAL
ncbi:MAG: UDP-N-acetylmuramoyl-L-alanyl-D-glutamate--2,6-diaminopimelate ligase [Acidimicrobiia bacterium]